MRSIVSMFVLVAAVALTACKEETPSAPAAPNTAPAAAAPSAPATPAVSLVADAPDDAVPSNKTCPIGGEDINPKGRKVTFDGKVYAFCCDDCINEFKKDPAKAVASLTQ